MSWSDDAVSHIYYYYNIYMKAENTLADTQVELIMIMQFFVCSSYSISRRAPYHAPPPTPPDMFI